MINTNQLSLWEMGSGNLCGVAKRLPGERIAAAEDVAAAYNGVKSAVADVTGADMPLVIARQVHGADVHVVGAKDASGGLCPVNLDLPGDALVTNERGVLVGVVTADCVPILLCSKNKVAAVHAGWRGMVAGVIQNTITAMAVTDIAAYIGAAICQSCYEVGGDVAEQFPVAFVMPGQKDKYYIDLRGCAENILRGCGVEDIVMASDCTRCNSEIYWSHRAHGLERGNQLTFVGLCNDAKWHFSDRAGRLYFSRRELSV